MKFDLERITREPGWPLLLWVRQEECGKESSSAIIQLIQGFKWVTEPCSMDQYTPTHSKTGASHQGQNIWHLQVRWIISAPGFAQEELENQFCTQHDGKKKPRSFYWYVCLKYMDLYQHLGAAERYFSLCLDSTESKQDPNSDKGDIQRCFVSFSSAFSVRAAEMLLLLSPLFKGSRGLLGPNPVISTSEYIQYIQRCLF